MPPERLHPRRRFLWIQHSKANKRAALRRKRRWRACVRAAPDLFGEEVESNGSCLPEDDRCQRLPGRCATASLAEMCLM
ncbi:hypothetical protein QQF64_020360 [Cirrhinus molitorella]|uniref:Uncharacterized protein n=1 Tax=Cirrhinus molitorella TaxID=172907 RepID=A0ABR3LAF2_9TELE